MKLYLYNLIILVVLCSCIPSATPVAATQAVPNVPNENEFVYEIPEWLRDAHVNVLMYPQWLTNPKDPYAAESLSIILLNPLTGERFTVKLEDGQFYEWVDHQTVGFSPVQNLECQSGMAYGYILNLSSGMLLVNDFGRYFCTANSSEEISVSTYYGGVQYFNGLEWVEFIPELTDLYNDYAAVSPDGTTMLITQGNLSADELNRIGVYDFVQRKEIDAFYVQNLNAIFQFVGEEHKIVYFEGNTPCILNWDVLERECGLPLPEEYSDPKLEYVGLDPSHIGFIYRGIKSTEGGGWIFCLYDIFKGEISSPMKNLEIFKSISFTSETVSGTQTSIRAGSVVSTLISPDEKFVYFSYQDTPGDALRQAVVSMDGEIFFDLGLLETNGYMPVSINESTWRPFPLGNLTLNNGLPVYPMD